MRILIAIALFVSVRALNQNEILQKIQEIANNPTTCPDIDGLSVLKHIQNIRDKKQRDDTVCKSCITVMSKMIDLRQKGSSKGTIIEYVQEMCHKFTDWGKLACNGYIDIQADTGIFILDNTGNITGERICALYLVANNCTDPRAEQWTVNIPPVADSAQANCGDCADDDEQAQLKILHITDVHYDPDYKQGSNADCGLAMCCHCGTPANASMAAGYWGDYHVCDMPWYSLVDLMDRVQKEKPDVVYFTGDIISHESWTTTREKNTQAIQLMYKLLATTFKNTSVFPILGNHEPHPTNFFSPESVKDSTLSTAWIFDLAHKEWSRWLPQETESTVKKGGFYTTLVRPGFRIVAINSNVCFHENFWMIHDDVDPFGQLQWLVDVLYKAEQNKEKVHLLSHIPPGEAYCHRQWSNQFRRVITRFAKTISAQFNGHTHYDEIRVIYNASNSAEVIGVAYNGGSFTTFIGSNPNYKTYSVDGNNYKVTDYTTYTYNLTEANENMHKPPRWFKLYSFQQAYGLNPSDFTQLGTFVDILSRNSATLKEYYKYYICDSDLQDTTKQCDDQCLKSVLCSITASETKEAIDCLL